MSKNSNRSGCVSIAGLALALAASGLACSSNGGAAGAETPGNTGSIDLGLSAGSLTINSVSYSIENGLGFRKTGTIDVTNSTRISATIGGIPAGTGYYIRLTAVAENDAYATCSGYALADIIAGSTTYTKIVLSCKASAVMGSVQIDGSINLCPTLGTLSIEPNETTVG